MRRRRAAVTLPQITEGVGSYVVTCVGENSEWGIIMKNLSEDRDETPLQKKLGDLATGAKGLRRDRRGDT